LKRNYDTIAGIYDRLARLVFGNAQTNAQLYLLQAIPPLSHILIAGGGTGWILEEIANIHPSGLTITYIDASLKMVSLAKKRNVGKNAIAFIAAPVESVLLEGTYDVVLTPFFFDNFSQKSLEKIFLQIDQSLSPDCTWLYCDFNDTGLGWQRMLLKIMYVFFRSLCGIEATHLPDADALFSKFRYKEKVQETFMKGFISAVAYKRV